jgi:hypothetical protein
MSQLNLYVPDHLKKKLQMAAKRRGLSLSRYVFEILERDVVAGEWSKHYLEQVLGGWQGELERPSQGQEEIRSNLLLIDWLEI